MNQDLIYFLKGYEGSEVSIKDLLEQTRKSIEAHDAQPPRAKIPPPVKKNFSKKQRKLRRAKGL